MGTKFWMGSMNGKHHSEDFGTDERIILTLMLGKIE
jgi:hypothetical protein